MVHKKQGVFASRICKWPEVTAADDLSMLDRLRQGGLPHVDATEPYEPVIDYSDDDDYAFIDDTDRDY